MMMYTILVVSLVLYLIVAIFGATWKSITTYLSFYIFLMCCSLV